MLKIYDSILKRIVYIENKPTFLTKKYVEGILSKFLSSDKVSVLIYNERLYPDYNIKELIREYEDLTGKTVKTDGKGFRLDEKICFSRKYKIVNGKRVFTEMNTLFDPISPKNIVKLLTAYIDYSKTDFNEKLILIKKYFNFIEDNLYFNNFTRSSLLHYMMKTLYILKSYDYKFYEEELKEKLKFSFECDYLKVPIIKGYLTDPDIILSDYSLPKKNKSNFRDFLRRERDFENLEDIYDTDDEEDYDDYIICKDADGDTIMYDKDGDSHIIHCKATNTNYL